MNNREINALVAEKAMGWRRIGTGWMRPNGTSADLPDFCDDPAASKQLEDRLFELGFTWSIQVFRQSDGSRWTEVKIRQMDFVAGYPIQVSMHAGVGSLEVFALAALEAVGVEVDRP